MTKRTAVLSLAVVCSAVMAMWAAPAAADFVVRETFTYPDNTSLTGETPELGGPWATHSGTADQLQVVGGAAKVVQTTQSEDVNVLFANGEVAGAGETFYAGFDLTVTATSVVTHYFAHFNVNNSTFTTRVFLTTFTGGDYTLGISDTSTMGATWATGLTFNTTYRIVISYNFDTKTSKLWVNPTQESDPSIQAVGTTSQAIKAFALREASGSGTTTETIDNLCVATTFVEALTCTAPTTGACCNGTNCTVVTPAQCSAGGGVYQGDGTTCSPVNPCVPPPTGACCNGLDCTVVTQTVCVAGGGSYQGDDTSCDPNPCLGPSAACCVETTCQMATFSGCNALGGRWYADQDCATFTCPTLPQGLIINELDCDQPGVDTLEFIELYDGGVGNTSLDGYIVVLYNGSTDVSYLTIDLTGYSTNAAGYFLIGSPALPGSDISIDPGSSGWLQNGQDGVALYYDSAANFPNGTVVKTSYLIDAIVYDTNDADDPELLVLLNPGQPQVDEGTDGQKSNQRCPNGSGGARNTDTYQLWAATPKAPNFCAPPLTGACCVEAACTIITPADCATAGGTYLGDGSTCTNVVCGCQTAAGAKAQQGIQDASGVIVCDVVVSNLTNLINSATVKSFQVQDATGGMTVFASTSIIDALLLNDGDPIQEGHTITISGTTDEYNGLFELSQGPPLPLKVLAKSGAITPVTPEPVLAADLQAGNPTAELIESKLVKLLGVTFVDTGNFTGLTNYNVTDGLNVAVVRIATESLDLVGTPIPTGPVDIVGIVTQYDTTAPYDAGYQLLPRSLADITPAEVGCTCPGNTTDDANNRVDENDIPTFIQALLEITPHECADVNGDEVVDGRDIQLFVERALALTPCGPVEPPSRAIVQCTVPPCQGDQIGVGYCHYEVIAEAVPGFISCIGYGLDEGVLFCVPCDGQCPPQDTVETFKWVDRIGPGVHCYFKARVYQPLTPCYVSCPGGLIFDNYP